MIPFVMILIVCGEFTPFVVLALGARVTPLTCRVPKQLEKERKAKMERKKEAVRVAELSSSSDLKEANAMALLKSEPETVRGVMCSCAALGLAKSHRLPGYVPGFMEEMFVNSVYAPKLKRWREYVAVDDALIWEHGGVRGLSADEVRIAVDERGGVDVGLDVVKEDEKEKTMRKWLQKWVEGSGKV